MRVEIFDVEHGFCALVTGQSGERILIDCGHNSTTGWRPSNYLLKRPLDLLIITNYDQDHLSDFPGVRSKIGFRMLSVNFSIAPSTLLALKRQQGPPSAEMRALVNELGTLAPPASIYLPSIVCRSFCIPFPWSGSDETNKHSLVVFMEADGISIVFPGDLSAEGWRELLSQPLFCECLRRVNIFVASHHGRKDGFCEEVFNYCSPDVVVISDDEIQFDTQQVNYSQYAKGVAVDGRPRYALTTRSDGKLTIESSTFGFTVKTSNGTTDNASPILRALLSHSKPAGNPSALGLLGLGSGAQALRSLDPPSRIPGLINSVPPRRNSILADLFRPPSQSPKPPASSLINPQPEDSLKASLLTELLKKRRES